MSAGWNAMEQLNDHVQLVIDHVEPSGADSFVDFRLLRSNGACATLGVKATEPVPPGEILVENLLRPRFKFNETRVFMGVSLRMKRGNRTALATHKTTLFFVDIDGADIDRSDVEIVDEVLELAEEGTVLAITRSGGGLHIYFRLDSDIFEREDFWEIRAHTAKLTGLKFASMKGTVDTAVIDPGRVVGVWGTFNPKRGQHVVNIYLDKEALPVQAEAPPLKQVVHRKTKISFPEGANKKLAITNYLMRVLEVWPTREVVWKAADILGEATDSPALASQALDLLPDRFIRDIKYPEQGKRRMWTYAKLASVCEALPSEALLRFCGDIIKDRMPNWVAEEPGQVEDIVLSLIRTHIHA